MMYTIINDLTPGYLKHRFVLKDSGYMLRGYKSLTIPKPKLEYKKRSYSYRGAKLWNEMRVDVKKARDVNIDKKYYTKSL